MSKNVIKLTSAEIASLWTGYLNDSMTKCVLTFMLKSIEDQEIKPVVQYACDTASNHLEQLLSFFKKEEYAVPIGFSDQDVNPNAPWLFSDIFCLTYVNHMAKMGMLAYSGLLSMTSRQDIREYFTEGLAQSVKLFNDSIEITQSKGIDTRHPYIEVPKETDYVDNKNYLSGLNPFNEKRPLNTIEISHLYQNISTNAVGVKLSLAFAQTTQMKDVQEFMIRAKEIAKKHMKIFGDILLKDDITAPQLPDAGVSDSTTHTFSDKLMMFHMSLLMSAGIGNYSTAAAASQRTDLMLNYERLSLEVSKLAKSGADIMIKNNWLEQPPGSPDRNQLVKKNH